MNLNCKSDKPLLVFGKFFCFKLRTGVLIVAAVEIILATMIMITHISRVVTNPFLLYSLVPANASEFFQTIKELPQSERPIPNYSAVVLPAILATFTYIVHFVVTAILIYGVRKNKFNWMRVWLWVRFVNMIDNIVELLSLGPFFATDIVVMPIWIVLSFVAIIIVRSYVIDYTQSEDFVKLEETTNNP